MMRFSWLAFAAPVLVAAPLTLPLWAQDKAAATKASAAAAKEKAAIGSKAKLTASEEAELAAKRRSRSALKGAILRCPKRPNEDQFRIYNRLSDEVLKLKQRRSRLAAAERRFTDLRRQILAQKKELLKLQRVLDEKLTEKEVAEAQARSERIRKLVKIVEVMQPQAGAQAVTGITMELLIELLLRMKPKKAAGILNLVPGNLASRTFEEVSNRRKGLIEALLERVTGE
jgi:flagellar motility protein MotE (MotC chaperone)